MALNTGLAVDFMEVVLESLEAALGKKANTTLGVIRTGIRNKPSGVILPLKHW